MKNMEVECLWLKQEFEKLDNKVKEMMDKFYKIIEDAVKASQ